MKSLLGSFSRKPDVSFYKNGRIDITARVARIIGIAPGDVLDVAFDGGEYYMFVREKANACIGRHEAQCWPTKKGFHNYRAHSKRLCTAIMKLSNAQYVARLPTGDRALLFDKTTPAIILIARNNLSEV